MANSAASINPAVHWLPVLLGSWLRPSSVQQLCLSACLAAPAPHHTANQLPASRCCCTLNFVLPAHCLSDLACPQARNKAAAEQHEQLRQLPADDALKASHQQLQEEVSKLQEQLDAATALQRATQVGQIWASLHTAGGSHHAAACPKEAAHCCRARPTTLLCVWADNKDLFYTSLLDVLCAPVVLVCCCFAVTPVVVEAS